MKLLDDFQGAYVKKSVEVSILGQKFQIRSESDDTYVTQIAGFVDKKMGEVIQSTKSVASLNVAILAAMNIADEYFKFRQDKDQRFKTLEKKVEDLIELVDLHL